MIHSPLFNHLAVQKLGINNFTNVFAQFKINRPQFEHFEPDMQDALKAASVRDQWIEDGSGNLLSAVLPLPLPPQDTAPHQQELSFPWSDGATRDEAFRLAIAQLLVFDFHAASDRGQVQLRISGQMAGTEGEPLFLFANVPRVLSQVLSKQAQAELLNLVAPPSVLAYRAVYQPEELLTLESQFVYLPRRQHVNKVKRMRVYEHSLKRLSHSVVHQVQLRMLYDLDAPSKNQYVSTLGSKRLSSMVLHALSCWPNNAFGELEDHELLRPSQQASKLLEGVLENVLPPKLPAPKPSVPKPIQPQAVQPKEAALTPLLRTAPVILAATPAVLAASAPPVADVWANLSARLSKRIVVDSEVMDVARAALRQHKPLLLKGAPGTGKTLLATLLAEALCGPNNFTLVTADARWTSADVLGGLRVTAGEGLKYSFMPGIMTRAAERHQRSMAANQRPHALIIDEFNRAHQDEAFGRLLTLLDAEQRQRMALISETDGAAEPVYLPSDFMLMATMNDADAGRLHEIGAALSRRFVSVHLGIPKAERAFLTQRHPAAVATILPALYRFVGNGHRQSDQASGQLRAFVPVGTAFMEDALSLIAGGLDQDAALATLSAPHFERLPREQLSALHACAQEQHLPKLALALEQAVLAAPF